MNTVYYIFYFTIIDLLSTSSCGAPAQVFLSNLNPVHLNMADISVHV